MPPKLKLSVLGLINKEYIIGEEEFKNLSAFEKGYAVYMAGNLAEQVNVPEVYNPSADEKPEYERGLHQAMINIIDMED